ncbi:calcitonin gene-related peptide type 1 receptor-like [Ostrea edulis]|uniref:calcitonin gene-related peptide type 1 receptor-like n=1 Tax=Ostrea edulis TaxID=37623 RepID=UPI0024AFF93D|nr:calcitonin gene-related peptide type 1 receptor-like [Ostrea edulis]XP_048754281.2 calcitonin gene-related peptide type 1 receptor-like [Ostrea edulis]
MLTLSTSLCLNFTAMYNVATTLFCYRFLKPLFSNDSNIYWNEEFRNRPYSFVATTENDDFPTGYSFVPDVDNATNIEIACSGLTKPDCMRWISCSRAAKDCCQRHVASHRSAPEYYCEATWDGVSCLDSTPNGTDVAVKCPSFYIPLEGPVIASKKCLSSGKWEKPEDGLLIDGVIHTYNVCKQKTKRIVGTETMAIQRLVTLVTNVISLAFLIPSLAVITIFRSPKNAEEIRRIFRIHQHFLLSLTVVSILTLIWDEVIVREHITKLHKEASVIEINSPPCKLLYTLQKYFRSTTYFWMLVEGINVFIPLIKSFQKNISMVWLYFIGWGVPLITVALYATLRSTIGRYDYKCWVYTFPEIEWIVVAPNYLTVLCNAIFLIVIVSSIAMKEKNTRSRTTLVPKPLRSLIFLIPLFGINFIFGWISYVTDIDWSMIVNRIVEGLQGVFVCILWIVCSKQVHKNVRLAVHRKCPEFSVRFRGRKFSTSSSTHLTQAVHPMSSTPSVHSDIKSADISIIRHNAEEQALTSGDT